MKKYFEKQEENLERILIKNELKNIQKYLIIKRGK